MKKYKITLIVLFCIVLILGGAATIGLNAKTIAKATWQSLKEEWNAGSNIESSVAENFFEKEKYIDLYGLTERLLGRNYIRDVNPSNVVVKDNHNNLQFISFPVDNTKSLEVVANLNEVLKKKGTPLLYVQTPLKIIEDFTELPDSVVDYSKANTDTFLDGLDKADVDYVDLRQNMIEDKLDLSTLFYKTDHHWTTQTAFWAVGQVVRELAERYGMILDVGDFYTNLENYNSVTYSNFFLGSQGRRVGRFYAGTDDYTLMTPKFDTNYAVTINKSDSSRTTEGTFEETRMLDLRYYDVNNLESYIEDYNPDLVLFVYKSIKTQQEVGK